MKLKAVIITIAGIVSLFMVTTGAAFLAIKNTSGIATGIYVDNVNLSGMTQEEAEQALTKNFHNISADGVITLRYDDAEQVIKPKEIDMRCDTKQMAKEAYRIGRTNHFFVDLVEKLFAIYYGKELEIRISYNQKKLQSIVHSLAQKINRPPVNASCVLLGGKIVKKAAVPGQEVEEQALLKNIEKVLNDPPYPHEIEVSLKEVQPAITDDDIRNINAVIGVYTTHFNPAAVNRSKNVQVAATALDDTLVKAHQVFSFNGTVGPRISSAGYKSAPVIIDDKVVPGIGGGVCQVSSTLYNAILLANLTPVERITHYQPVSYVPKAFDATVAYGVIDFRFRNSLANNVYILTKTTHSTLTIYILGNRQDKGPYQIILQNQDNADGSVSAYRLYKEQNKIIKRELLHRDKW